MPTIHREEGFRFVIYPDDHAPPHVHVFYAGTEAKVSIGTGPEARPLVIRRRKMSDRDTTRAIRIVEERWEWFLAEWRRLHVD